jgi:NDP-sugar pyrophosphorylase family protein
VFNDVTGIILAGAHPWTNSPFDSVLPRTLLPIAHRPVIWYGLSWLHRQGIREAAVCGNRETRLLQARLERHVPRNMAVSYHEDPMPRGAAGSARDAALSTTAQTFVVADGTLIPEVDLTDLLLTHQASGACVTVVVHSEEARNGNPPLREPSGIYVFSRRALESVPATGFCDIKEKLIPQLYAANERIAAYEAPATTPRVLDAFTYMAVNEWMIERLVRSGAQHDGYRKLAGGLVHRDSLIADDVALIGPVLIGPGARIKTGAVIVGPTSIGRDAVIEGGALVSRSAVWRRAVIGELATADRCIVADDAVVGAGTRAFRGVVTSDEGQIEADWVAQEHLQAQPVAAFNVNRKLTRPLFGASWFRSSAAQ